MKFTINRDLHSRYALLKAAYHFTDEYYVLLDQDDSNYYIDISAKNGKTPENISGMFANEILAQSTRESILNKTSSIRELILARAFASTIISDKSEKPNKLSVDSSSTADTDKNIFKDWYE